MTLALDGSESVVVVCSLNTQLCIHRGIALPGGFNYGFLLQLLSKKEAHRSIAITLKGLLALRAARATREHD
jgi:hypothetical protein